MKLKSFTYIFLGVVLSSVSQTASINQNLTSLPINVVRGPYLQTGTPNSMIIKWRTDASSDSKVWYGTSVNTITNQVTIPSSVTNHEVKITGLSPSSVYYYMVGSTAGTLTPANTNQFFKTSPNSGAKGKYKFWVIGDAGTGTANQTNAKNGFLNYIGNNHIDGWIWLGDNAYNLGLDDEYQRHVFRVYQESFFKNTNLYPAPGNHDYGKAKRNPTDISYFKIFTMPTNGEAGGIPSGSESYYSVDYGNVHLISLDSQGELDGGFRIYDTLSRQITWLKKDLSANKLPWTIVYFHHPPYTKGSHDSDREAELVKIRENLLVILERYKVDMVLTGHSHVYERTHPLRGHYGEANSFDPKKHVVERTTSPNHYLVGKGGQGVIYIVSGSGGQVGGQAEGYPLRAATYYNTTVGGSLLLDFNDNRLEAKWICADGQVRDRFSITKEK